MIKKIILASKSKVRKKILEENGINCVVEPANIDEDLVKDSLIKEGALPAIVSKNLAELKANKISQKKNGELVLGADREKIAFEVFNAGGDRNNFTKRGIVREIQQKLPNSKVVYQDHGSDPRNYRVNFTLRTS